MAGRANQAGVGDRVDSDGLLDEAEKQLATVARGSTVEAEGELVQVVVQVRATDGALMGAEQPPLEQADHAMHARQEGRRPLGVSAKKRGPVVIPGGFHPFVAVPPVGMDGAAAFDRLFDKRL